MKKHLVNSMKLIVGLMLIGLTSIGLNYLWSIDPNAMVLQTDDPELTLFEWYRDIITYLGQLVILGGIVLVISYLQSLGKHFKSLPPAPAAESAFSDRL